MYRDVLARRKSHFARPPTVLSKASEIPPEGRNHLPQESRNCDSDNSSRNLRIIASFFFTISLASSAVASVQGGAVRCSTRSVRIALSQARCCLLRPQARFAPRRLWSISGRTCALKPPTTRNSNHLGLSTKRSRSRPLIGFQARKNKATPKLMSASLVPGVRYRRQSNDSLRSVNERLKTAHSRKAPVPRTNPLNDRSSDLHRGTPQGCQASAPSPADSARIARSGSHGIRDFASSE